MKKIIFLLSFSSLIIFTGCSNTKTVKGDPDAEKQVEENDTYVPWWITNNK